MTAERLAEIRRHVDYGYTRETLVHDIGLLDAEREADKAALRLALEALDRLRDAYSDVVSGWEPDYWLETELAERKVLIDAHEAALAAVKARLA